jgi:hypothetical protein
MKVSNGSTAVDPRLAQERQQWGGKPTFLDKRLLNLTYNP